LTHSKETLNHRKILRRRVQLIGSELFHLEDKEIYQIACSQNRQAPKSYSVASSTILAATVVNRTYYKTSEGKKTWNMAEHEEWVV
jgi:hypothetical protein